MSSSIQRLQEHLDAAGAEVAALRAELVQKERQLDAAGAEVAALREEAAKQVASALQQSGDLQQEVRCLSHSLKRLCGAMAPPRGGQEGLPLLQHVLHQLDCIAPPLPPPPFPLLLLPDAALHLVVTKAGVRVRQLCNHLRDMFPPPTALQPHLCHGVSGTQLPAALRSTPCLQHVTRLDLSKAPSCVFDDSTLLHVAGSCRQLCELRMSRARDAAGAVIPSGIAALTSLASSLQVLDTGCAACVGPSEVEALAQLTSLRRLTVALCDIERQAVHPLTSLQLLTRVDVRSTSQQLLMRELMPTLASLPLLVDLSLGEEMAWEEMEHVALLHGMLRLTALRMDCCGCDTGETDDQGVPDGVEGALVRGLAALTNLRRVELLGVQEWGDRELGSGPGRLLLQSLELDLYICSSDADEGCLLDAVATGEHLTRLAVSEMGSPRLVVLTDAIRGSLQLVRALRVLELENVFVPANLFELLAGRRSLHKLAVKGCVVSVDAEAAHGHRPPSRVLGYGGLSRLTQLCCLSCTCAADTENPMGEVGCLTNLTKLALWSRTASYRKSRIFLPVGASDLWRLLPLQQLRRLRLPEESGSQGVAALAALALLPALEWVKYQDGVWCSGCDIRFQAAGG